tara:strand:+ start:1427 stop:2212 length:786 start_codon:yes stop_codon:yes gene_type:complete
MTGIDIHIVGIGNLGISFLEGFKSLKDNTCLYLYENNIETIKNLESSYSVTTDIDQIDSGVLLLCIKPNNLNEFINVNKSKISDQVLIASPLAGVSINHFENHFKNKVLRLMPNLAIKNNSGFIPYTKNYDEDYLHFIEKLNQLGQTNEYPEDLFDIITAIFGSGPAWYFELSSKITDAATKLGMETDDAKFIIEQLILSLPSFLGEHKFGEIVNNIKSPNGTTEAGINSLKDNSFDKIIYEAIEAAVKRSITISKETNDG